MKKHQLTKQDLLKFMKFSLFQGFIAMVFTSLTYAFDSKAQEILEQPVTIQCNQQKLESVLSKIEESANVKFVFSSRLIQSTRVVTLNARQEKLSTVLASLLSPMKIGYQVSGNKIILNRIAENRTSINESELPNAIEDPISGKVVDAKGEPLPGVSITIKGTNKGTTSNIDGTFKINANVGETLVLSFIGFANKEVKVASTQALSITLEESLSTLNEVVVTGTRSSGRTKIETPVPVDIIPLAQVTNNVGQVDINQILTFIAPSFQSARQAIADGTDHVDPAQLRGLGPDQVLVLVNGKRRHQSALVNVNGTVNRGTVGTDMNAIPATAVDKIEILRDGAAAQYGSDAIAGVINIVLKKQEGLSGNLSHGLNVTSYDKNWVLNNGKDASVNVADGGTTQVGLNYGIKIGEKGFINLTGEFVKRGETNRSGTYTGQVFPSVNGQNIDNQLLQDRGLSRDDFDMRIGNSRVSGGGIVLNSEFGIGKNSTIYAFGGFNNKKGNAAGFYRYPSGVPAAVRTNVFTVYPNGFLPEINSNVTDISMAVGVRGKFKDWNYDLSNTFGQNTFDFNITNSVNYTQALASSSFQREFDAGGLKFLQNTINLDLNRRFEVLSGLNVAFGAEQRTDQFGIRAGEEASWKNYNTSAGVAAGAQVFAGFLPTNAATNSRNSVAAYVDLEQEFSKKFLVAGALRFENYSDFGSTLNYKLAGRYKVVEGFAIRASTSSGFRAPSMQQRFYSKTNTLFVSQGGQLVAVESGTFTNDSKPAEILGIPKLKQETSQSYTIGATVQLGTKFELTIDAYQIDIKDRIVLTNNFSDGGNAAIRAQLAAANATTANFFTNAVDTRSRGIEPVLNYNTKIGENQTLRITLAGVFIKNEVIKGADGKPAIKASPILISTNQVGNYFNREDQSRIEVANPQDKVSLMVNYKIGKLGLMVRAVRFGKVTYLDPSIDPSKPENFPVNALTGQKETLDQVFAPKITTDLTVNYELRKGMSLSVGGNNIFDVYQDRHIHSNNFSLGRFVYSRRVQQFGFNGRYIFARLNFNF
ncbi:MAG: TonB-dependent receptor domain-containing protein [Spirosomataceae bacterium]